METDAGNSPEPLPERQGDQQEARMALPVSCLLGGEDVVERQESMKMSMGWNLAYCVDEKEGALYLKGPEELEEGPDIGKVRAMCISLVWGLGIKPGTWVPPEVINVMNKEKNPIYGPTFVYLMN